jgi:hypothetical protein
MDLVHHNHELVRKALNLLREGLKPFLEKEMLAVYGEVWEQEARNALNIPSHFKLNWDTQAILKLIDRRWSEVFRNKLERKHRSWVIEARELRNDFAHEEPLSDEDTLRGLDTIQRLLAAVSAPESEEVTNLKAAATASHMTDVKPPISKRPARRFVVPATPSRSQADGEQAQRTVNVWRLIPHHADKDLALAWSRYNRRIAIGWGRVGDIKERGYRTSAEIGAAIRKYYPELHNSGLGGPSLWNFYAEMQKGDLVILSASKPRELVVEVDGEYEFRHVGLTLNGVPIIGDYWNQRMVQISNWDPDDLWHLAGARPAPRQSSRWTLFKCESSVPQANN